MKSVHMKWELIISGAMHVAAAAALVLFFAGWNTPVPTADDAMPVSVAVVRPTPMTLSSDKTASSLPPKAFDSEKPASQRDAVSVGPVPSNSPAQSVTAARGSDAATPNPEGRGTAARTYASAVSRTTIDSSVSADADVLIAKTAKHEQKASIPLGNFDREGFRAPVLVIRGLEWDVVDRLIRSGSAVLWIELNAGAGQLVFDKNGLRELSGPVSDQEFAERRFDLSAVKDIRIRGAAALAGFAASFNVSKSALSLARFQLLIRAPLDEQFLAEQQAFAERNGLTLTQINRTEGLIDFDPDGYPVFRVVRATGADGKVIP